MITILKLSQLELHNNVAIAYITGKGGKTRSVPLMEKTVQHYKLYLDYFHAGDTRNKDDYLFYTTIKGIKTRMSEDNVWSLAI